jgi:alkylation response protein AidB-like acyl-CoA dehydrogenase
MVLTEPDAGSDLQAVALRAWQDDDGQWRLTGVKRFITNGCGDVLLTLARSEPDIKRRARPEPLLASAGRGSRCATSRRSWASTARRRASWSTTTRRPS